MWKKKKKQTIKVTRFAAADNWYVMGYKPQDDSLKGRLRRLWRRHFGKKKQCEPLRSVAASDAVPPPRQRYAIGLQDYMDLQEKQKMTDDTERKEAKCLGHRVLPSPYTFVPNGFMSPPDGWVSSGKPCEDMPQWLKDAKMAIDKEEGKRLGDIGLKSTVGDGKPGLKSTVGSECPQSDGLRVTVTEPYKVYYSPPLVMQWAEKQDPSNWEVKTNEDRLGEPVGPITMEETLIRAGKGIMERLIFEEKRNWHKREKNMIGMGKQSKKPRRLTGWEISTKRSPVVKPPDDTERKEAKCLGTYTFNPNSFMSDHFGTPFGDVKITNQADCVHEPITRVTLPHITRPPNTEKRIAVVCPKKGR